MVTNAIDKVCNTVRDRLAGHTTSSCGAPVNDDVGAWLHFTHFDALPEGISCISPDYLWYCWKRGVALQMAHGQAGVDGIIPVFVGKLSQRFRAPSSTRSDANAGIAAAADEESEIDEAQAAQQMTYIAWEAKFRDEAMSLTEARHPSRAGPTLLPAACDAGADADAGTDTDADARTELERTEVAPLTRAALVTVIADLGTKQAFAASRSLGPRAEIARYMGGKRSFVRLWIRGIEDPRAYPCFDALGVREKMSKLFQTVRLSPAYEEENEVVSPVWRPGARPESRSRVIEGPLQYLSWSSPSMPETASEDHDHLDEPMEL